MGRNTLLIELIELFAPSEFAGGMVRGDVVEIGVIPDGIIGIAVAFERCKNESAAVVLNGKIYFVVCPLEGRSIGLQVGSMGKDSAVDDRHSIGIERTDVFQSTRILKGLEEVQFPVVDKLSVVGKSAAVLQERVVGQSSIVDKLTAVLQSYLALGRILGPVL